MRPALRRRRFRRLSPLVFTVAPEDDGARLDQWLAGALDCSRREAQRLCDDHEVRVDGARGAKGMRVKAGAEVRVAHAPATTDEKRPVAEPDAPFELLYSDDALVAMAKPAGVPTHPLRAGERGTLANALVARFPECADVADDAREGGVAHRLDTETSGLVLAGRTRPAWQSLRRSFGDGAVAKEYLALVSGDPPPTGTVDLALVHAGRRVRVAGDRDFDAQSARTDYEVLARGAGVALVRARSSSGRMHQIRVHFMHLGHPLVGDELYGGPPPLAGTRGHFLHASAAAFPHPTTGARTRIEAPLPADRGAALEAVVGWPHPRV
ncbi:MAG: pseudouridine synthase, RluA family [Myxococcales bacterium]|nr:pseudouridine synthase, RluA family [Myxococcales bacterium]